MQTLAATVSDLVTMKSGVIALYFFVSLVVNLAQAQASSATGDALGHARALQQGIASVLLHALASSASVLVPGLQGYLTPSDVPQTAAAALSTWEVLARFVIVAVLAGTSVLTAVAVVFA
jgi:hypothetical protein